MKRQWTHDELTELWTLLPDELKLLANKTGATRLGFGWFSDMAWGRRHQPQRGPLRLPLSGPTRSGRVE
jgi:hypothetical protein